MSFNKEQLEAIESANDPTIKKLFITGSGGTGKSHVIKEIVKHIPIEDLVLLAPTHSAARLIGGETIHGYFKIVMQLDMEAQKEENALNCKLDSAELEHATGKVIIIDEVSMLGKEMMDTLIRNLRVKKLILFGDPQQLNPVKDRAVNWSKFCDKTITLTKNYRTSNPEVLKAINHFRAKGDDSILKMLPKVAKYADLEFNKKTVCIAHKNKTLSQMQNKLVGYGGARLDDEVMTFATSTTHLVMLPDPRTGLMKKSPYYVNGDIVKVISKPLRYYTPTLYSVEVENEDYFLEEPIDKNPKFPQKVEVILGDYDEYQNLLSTLFEEAKDFAKSMVKKYGTGMRGERAIDLKPKFTKEERSTWGGVWASYMSFKSKSYARHKQFVTSYKIQGRAADHVIVHWDDLPDISHKYVALSRAVESIQLLTRT